MSDSSGLENAAGQTEKSGLPEITPDFIEQDEPETIDNIVPTRGYEMMPLIGLGGSAGSLLALQEFFKAMPEESGMAFVVVVHLSPEHASVLPELIGRSTKMRVHAAEDGERVESNCVYVIPPGKHLASVDGHLRLTDLVPERGTRVAVDLFFRSLADTHGPHAAAIVLSGADGDGALGIKRIKERGGLTIAQDPDEAEHRGMPQSAIATGMVDWVLRVAEMPGRLLSYRANEQRLRVPPEEGPQPTQPPKTTADENETALREVLAFLRMRTGRDFSYYKRATIVRRIARRMQINSVDDLPAYLPFLRTHPGEAGALLQDLLISVTNFFRDRDAFDAVELLIPQLFKGKGPGDCVRAWVPACATGEETFSMAMLLLEHARTLDAPPGLQIFGCDLDENAIQVARAGAYPNTITADVSEERLQRFFIKEAHGYRVRREVREIVVFAAHDLLKDAPFSRMDLISCRNLLIYLNREAQQRVLDIFHFALKPQGLLFLGSSEMVEEESPLFKVLDKKHRIFVHVPAQRIGLPVPAGQSTLMRALEAQERARGGPVLPSRAFLQTISDLGERQASGLPRLTAGELHSRLVERFSPPSVVINADQEIVHVSENAGRFLQVAGGEPTMNLLQMVHPMLRMELRGALFQAAETGTQIEVPHVPLELDGRQRTVTLRVAPAREIEPGFLLVIFELTDAAPGSGEGAAKSTSAAEPVAHQLEREVEVMKTRLRDTIEQYEASNEELKASNEELQAMNEELRSASEELETSREELQSINEELTTVNAELKGKIEEVGRSNSDLHNLMAATAIATLFLDRELRIMRYTPSAATIFRVIPSDVGRLITDLRHQLDYPELTADAQRVLENLTLVEREVRSDGRWFLARLLPYRTLDDRIAGVVLTFVDITEGKRAGEALRLSEERQRLILDSARDYTIFTLDLDRRVTSWNPGAEMILGFTEAEMLGQSGDIMFVPEDREQGIPEQEAQEAAAEGRAENERWHLRKDGSRLYGSGLTQPLRDPAGAAVGFVKIMRDLTESMKAQDALRASERRLQRMVNVPRVGVLTFDYAGTLLHANDAFLEMVGYGREEFEAKKHTWRDFTPSEHVQASERVMEQLRATGRGGPYEKEYLRQDGTRIWMMFVAADLGDGTFVEYALDVSDRRQVEESLRTSEERFRTLSDAVPQIIWTNSSDGIANYFNRRWFEYTGLSLEESAGPGWQAVVHPDDAPASVERWQRALAIGEVFDTEYRLRRADGTYRWFIGRNVPIRDSEDRVTGWFGTATDIQDLKEAEGALRTNEEQFRRALEDAPIPVIMQAEDGQVMQISKTWTELTGYTQADIPTFEAWLNRAYGPGADQLREHVHQLFSGESRQLDTEIEVSTSKGEHRCWAFSASAPGTLRDGRRFIVGMALDITDRKAVEAALRESQERLRLIVENARDYAIFSLDLNRRITSWNAGAQRILGYSQHEAIGQPGDMIFTPEDRANGAPEHEAKTALTEGRASDERWHVRKDGSRFFGSGVMMSMHDAQGKAIGLVKIFRDHTERLRAKKALEQSLHETEQARAEAEAAGRAKDHFLAILSHELRTPLTPVLMVVQGLSRRKDLSAPIRKSLEMIERNVQIEAHFIDDLLDLTRISRGILEITRKPVDLHQIARHAMEVAAPDIKGKSQHLTVALDAAAHETEADATRLQQVFWNLLKNASKFTPEGGAITIHSRNNEAGDRIVIEVTDTGIGFEPEAAERIFDAFTQANESIAREFGGLGLGLAISKAAVTAHGGTLSASSAGRGQGATFTVELPLAAPQS